MIGITIDSPKRTELATVADWISASGELHLISDLTLRKLADHTLRSWVETGIESAVVRRGGKPIAFATLSASEASLPSDTVEICHLIVHPSCRRRYEGSHLVLELSRKAREMGFSRAVGRVVPQNSIAKLFLSSLRWARSDVKEDWMNGNIWYTKSLEDVY